MEEEIVKKGLKLPIMDFLANALMKFVCTFLKKKVDLRKNMLIFFYQS
jgi:hypothetical protein